jgi:hypothetical protein
MLITMSIRRAIGAGARRFHALDFRGVAPCGKPMTADCDVRAAQRAAASVTA